MVVGAFPAAKLGALLLKQISKPIANTIKSQAKSSPVFRKYVCMPPAQFYNWCEIKAKMWVLNLGKPVNIPVLNEAMAIELGANLLGEGVIFIIAAGILISEYNRSAKKEALKEEMKRQETIDIQNTIRELFIQTEEQGAQLRELTRKLSALETRLGTKSISAPSKPSESEQPIFNKSFSSDTQQKSIINPPVESLKSNEPATLTSQCSKPKLPYSGIVLRAVDEVEDQFWGQPYLEQRSDNYLLLSLYYVQQLLRLQD